MADPISAIGHLISTAKRLYEISEKMKNVEAKQIIADLNESLTDIRGQVFELKEENLKLREQLATSQRQQKPQDRLEIREGKYYLREPGPGEHPGPYCVGCFASRGKLVPLTKLPPAFNVFGDWNCSVCKEHFQ